YLASIFGTEKDKVNCSFYFKIGACRHGDRCSRLHNRPTFSQTILLQNLYLNPQNAALTADGSHIMMDDVQAQQEYDEFFEEIFVELEDKCTRGGFCNFMHLKPISRELRRELYGRSSRRRGGGRRWVHLKDERDSRSPPPRDNRRDRDRGGDRRDRDRGGRDRKRSRSRDRHGRY
ncbi:splicing factor U2AF 26 kDa subunit, partial [Elysia marginata]